MKTLGEELPIIMAKVRDEILPAYMAVGTAGEFAARLMRQDLDDAERVMISGDLSEMIRIYRSLIGYRL